MRQNYAELLALIAVGSEYYTSWIIIKSISAGRLTNGN